MIAVKGAACNGGPRADNQREGTRMRRQAERLPMFDSPFEYCTVCRACVLLDQTQAECAREHGCGGNVKCVLRRFFTGIDFAAGRKDPPAPCGSSKSGGDPLPHAGPARRLRRK